jgi:hypothetical protein
MKTKKDYEEAVLTLKTTALKLLGVMICNLPDKLDPESEFAKAGGDRDFNVGLKVTTEQIGDIMACYDDVQESLGGSRHYGTKG